MGRLKRMWDRMRGKKPRRIEEQHEGKHERLLSDAALQRVLGNAWQPRRGPALSDKAKTLTRKERKRRKAKRRMAKESRRRNRS